MSFDKMQILARSGDYNGILRMLEEGHDPNRVGGKSGNATPLHLAALHGKKEVVELLLDNGADPNALDNWHCTPLHNAAGGGFPDIVRELLEAGAATDIRSSVNSRTPIDFAREKGKYDVIPILQKYAMKNRAAKKHRKGANDAPNKNQLRKGGRVGRKVVVRKRSNSKNPSEETIKLPGEAGNPSKDDQKTDERYGDKKRDLQRKLQRMEENWKRFGMPANIEDRLKKKRLQEELNEIQRQEEMSKLSKEISFYRRQLNVALSNHDSKVKKRIKAINKMQEEIYDIASQEDSEILAIKMTLWDLEKRMRNLEIEKNLFREPMFVGGGNGRHVRTKR